MRCSDLDDFGCEKRYLDSASTLSVLKVLFIQLSTVFPRHSLNFSVQLSSAFIPYNYQESSRCRGCLLVQTLDTPRHVSSRFLFRQRGRFPQSRAPQKLCPNRYELSGVWGLTTVGFNPVNACTQKIEIGNREIGNRTLDFRIRSTVTLPTELRGRTEKVGLDSHRGQKIFSLPRVVP